MADTAKKSWDALKNYHEKSTLANKVYLVRSICAFKLEENGDARAHINRMQDLFTKLNDIGKVQLSTLWSKIFLLSSLPELRYIGVGTWRTFDVAKQHVIAEYERHANVVGSSSDSILKTVAKIGNCFFCKRSGHQKKDCHKYKNWLAKKGNDDKGRKGNDGKSADKVNSIEESNFIFSVGNTQKKHWIVDSGATRHVVNSKRFFTEIDDSYRGSVELANGESTAIQGIGTGN